MVVFEFIIVLVVAGLVLVFVLKPSLRGGGTSSTSAHVAREVQEAKDQVTGINEQARQAILDEALHRAQGQATATRLDRFPKEINGDDHLR
jgi:hypothetical protein